MVFLDGPVQFLSKSILRNLFSKCEKYILFYYNNTTNVLLRVSVYSSSVQPNETVNLIKTLRQFQSKIVK